MSKVGLLQRRPEDGGMDLGLSSFLRRGHLNGVYLIQTKKGKGTNPRNGCEERIRRFKHRIHFQLQRLHFQDNISFIIIYIVG